MPYMTDMRHYLDALDPALKDQMPAGFRRIAKFFGSIVEGVTSGWDDATDGCAVTTRCIGRIGRRRCTDRVVARIHADRKIEWVCVICGEHGIIYGWEGTPWNLTGQGDELFPNLDVMIGLDMSIAEFEAVASIRALDAAARRVLAAGRVPEDDLVEFNAPSGWLEHLIGFVSAEAKRSRSKKKVPLYEAVLDRFV